jgi:glycosyltransferase involved in cell wall biosynthesis
LKKVVYIIKFIPNYRISFFENLKKKLEKEGYELVLVYGNTFGEEVLKNITSHFSWGHFERVKSFKIGKFNFIWQNVFPHVKGADLVITEQASSILYNHLLIFLKSFFKYRIALMGHGLTLKSEAKGLKNRFKIWYTKKADFFMAYTPEVKDTLVNRGYPESRIFVFNNSIDTENLKNYYVRLKGRYKEEPNSVIFIGSMYKLKKIDFLIDSIQLIKKEIPDLKIYFIGEGPESDRVRSFCDNNSWAFFHSRLYDEDKLEYFVKSKLILMPGTVGLAVLDSFATETPLVTTQHAFHSPEFEYIENGVNGIIVTQDVQVYADTVVDLLRDTTKLNKLKRGCTESARKYNIRNMIDLFTHGIKNMVPNP